MLEVAAGFGEVPRAAGRQLARRGITLDITDLDRVPSHLRTPTTARSSRMRSPFHSGRSFDVVSCSLFAHHLEPARLSQFAVEALRVSRSAVLINDWSAIRSIWRWSTRAFR